MSGLYGRIYSNYFRSQDGSCLNKYYKFKNDIEQRIDAFNKISNRIVQTEWDKLNSYIIQKDKELKECYRNGHVKVKLTDVNEINNFRNRCNRNRTCKNRATPATPLPIIKHTAQRTCNKGEKCKKETAVTDDVKLQSRLVPGDTDSKSSERKDPHEQGQMQVDVQKSRQEIVVPQPQTITMPSGSSDGTHDKASQEIVNNHSITSVVVGTQERPLNASSPSGISELDSSPGNPSSKCVSGKDPVLTCISTGEFIDTKDIQNNQYSGNPLNTNLPGSQDSVSEIVAEGTGDNKDIIRLTGHNLFPNESALGSVQRSGDDPLITGTDGRRTSTVVSDRENSVSELSSASLASAPSIDAGNNGVTDFVISNDYKAHADESKSVKVYHDHPPDSERSCIEPHCSAEKVGKLTDDTLDIYGKVISAIKDNPQIIKTSMPIGIAMLLGLLLKYTPLWRVLTKNNRKKGAGIIEELNSVVQEPSIMDDERSIPFSYGAFEYSS
ncbi:hypothetical protein PVBG_05673 [Plasmodium vivax Brazil I]|uniref:Variable surface protein Vir18 n=1 Tax=Plasmodium vivax (strain Brazil I) TaxID=1033975 RepID=A0A0J9T2A8_PLAV1|nr:hypothetical protein PVBG_05673 [Plasmodium vivax Brazil I]